MNSLSFSSEMIPEISVAIPTFNEEDNVVQITEAVMAELRKVTSSFEIIIIDNGSSDQTRPLIRQLCVQYSFVRGIFNSRNFGQMRSPTHAIFEARGQAVINLCADFQDPPALIPQFIEAWRRGDPIVLGVREAEKSGRRLTAMRDLSYYVMGQLGEVQTISGATGFGLYDRRVVEVLRQWRDPEPFFRAMLVESGFPITTIYFPRAPRERGQSKNGWRSLTVFALSALPLVSRNVFRISFSAGLMAMLAGVAGTLLGLILSAVAFQMSWVLWLGLAVLVMGALFGLLGMIGLQVMSVSDRVRGVPLVIELERINFPTP